MAKHRLKDIIGLVLIFSLFSFPYFANADGHDGDNTGADPGTNSGSTMQGRCQDMTKGGTPYEKFPDCAETPANCESNPEGFHPLNCMFLEEPFGGQTGYDLYVHSCAPAATGDDSEEGDESDEGSGDVADKDKEICKYRLWRGEFITDDERGPLQALLTYEPGKEYQGSLGLVYSYLGVVYNFLSGIIVALTVFIIIISGVQMIVSNGDAEQFSGGRKRIIKALVGMAIWFLASVILYTINPIFFRF